MKRNLWIAVVGLAVLPGGALAAPQVDISGKLEMHELTMATDDALQGLPFTLDTPGVYYHYRGKYLGDPRGLTDAREGDTPTADMYFSGPEEILVRWDLGPVPEGGRELRTIRVWVGMDDGQRNRFNLKFSVRNAPTGEWRDVCPFVKFGGDWSEANTFRSVTLTFPAGEVQDFDAVRLHDGAGLAQHYAGRFVEVDAVTAAQVP
jgi:hypothetical protein